MSSKEGKKSILMKTKKTFYELNKPNHPIRNLALKYSKTLPKQKCSLMLNTEHESVCFLGNNHVECFIMYNDHVNKNVKVPYPFDKHTTCLEVYLDSEVYKGKEFTETDVEKFDFTKLKDKQIKDLIENHYCKCDEDDVNLTHIIIDKIEDIVQPKIGCDGMCWKSPPRFELCDECMP
jgi:hypothetical protein